VTQKPDNLGRVDDGASRRTIALSTIAFAFVAAAVPASVTDANASAREVNASSYGFADSLLPNTGLEQPGTLSLSGRDWALKCSVNCGPAFGTLNTSRSELLTSNTADVATRKTVDSAGHAMGRGRAPGAGRLRLAADELGCRVGAHGRRKWLPFVVAVVRHAVGRALAAE
jgi:hypothetical protein